MNLLLLLGAGFSKWAADLPIARELFDLNVEPFGPREERLLSRLQSIKAQWDGSHPSDQTEQFIAHAIAIGGAYRDLVLWYVQRRLVAPFIWEEWHAGRRRRHVLQVDELRVDNRPGVKVVRDFLVRCHPDAIVTLNYDMLVEYALRTRHFHYGQHGEVLRGRGPYPVSQWCRPVRLTGAIPLVKVHRSVSWDAEGRYPDGRRGLRGPALIVAPVPEKRPPSELHEVWTLAQTVLARATRVVAFGVAFNPYDEAVLALLRNAKPDSVLLIDPTPKTAAVRSLWPSAHIDTAVPPPDGDNGIRDWLHRKWT